MTENPHGDSREALPTRDFVRAEPALDGVCVETLEWDRALQGYRIATAVLTPVEAERLASAIAVAARDARSDRELRD